MSRIVLGVSGGIAAYKACIVVRLLREAGHEVRVVPTPNALRFVGSATWEALSGKPIATDVFTDVHTNPHVTLGRWADLVVVAPASADLLARARAGRANDLLTATLLTATCPQVLFPAMHTEMWAHPATADNVATLRGRGVVVVDPGVGRLAGPDTGPGRMPEPDEIAATCEVILSSHEVAAAAAGRDLAGRHVVVTAGGTREALDPVRYIGNSSSGRMGVAIAAAAALRGAQVTLVAANVSVPLPSGVRVVPVVSTADLAQTMDGCEADVVVMAAAVADYRPVVASGTKLKKADQAAGLTLHLTQTTDILAGLGARSRQGQVIVGFAAETIADRDELLRVAGAKLARKRADLLVVNDVSGGKVFGRRDNDITIIDASGVVARASAGKAVIAHTILDAVAVRLHQGA